MAHDHRRLDLVDEEVEHAGIALIRGRSAKRFEVALNRLVSRHAAGATPAKKRSMRDRVGVSLMCRAMYACIQPALLQPPSSGCQVPEVDGGRAVNADEGRLCTRTDRPGTGTDGEPGPWA